MKMYILNNPSVQDLLSDNRIVVVDGGARGELFSPFNLVDKGILRIVRFEPDPGANIIIDNSSEI